MQLAVVCGFERRDDCVNRVELAGWRDGSQPRKVMLQVRVMKWDLSRPLEFERGIGIDRVSWELREGK